MMKEVFLLSGHDSEVLFIEWHPIYSNHLISSDVEGKICYWVLPNTLPSEIQIHSPSTFVPACSFDLYGDFFASLCYDKTIKIWEVNEKIKCFV